MGSETRKRTQHIMVRVSPGERKEIEDSAAKCDLSAPAYLRQLGLSYVPSSTVDIQAFDRLGHLQGDLGRIGGLLKMWLSDPTKKGFGNHLNIPELVKELIELQQEIKEVAKNI